MILCPLIFWRYEDFFYNGEFVLKKILRSLGVRVGLCLKLCLIFQEIYPKYVYNRYAYKKNLV